MVAGLGRDGAAGGPDVRLMIPPALMEQGAYGMNQTLINTVFPRLVPLVAAAHTAQVRGHRRVLIL